MAYGFEAFNASGNYLLTDTYVKPWFMGKATIATIVGPTEITFKEDTEQTSPIVRNFRAYQVAYSIPYFYGNQKKGFAAITMPNVQVFYSPFVGWTSGYNYVIDVLIPTSLTPDITMAPEVYLFCTEHINVYTGTGYGLQIFNNVPQCTYDSNTQAFRPLYAIKQPAKFPVIQSPFLGAQPTLEITYLQSLNADYPFNSGGFDLLTKPIYVLPEFSLPLFVKDQATINYTVLQTDPFWFYNFKLFYRRNTGNGIQSRSYFYETFYEGEGGAPPFTWSAWGNSEITVVISDGTRYVTTPGNGQFPNATYDITVSPSSPAEGAPFTVTVTTTNVPNGSTFNYTLTGNSINPTDFRGVYASGSLTIQNNSGSVTFRPVIDGVADTENATFELFDPGGQIIKAITITITNTPAPAAVYTLSRTPASGNINEGSSFTITLTTNYVVAGQIHNYTVTGCDNLDGTGLNSAGTFPATVGDYELATSSKTFSVAADGRSDGFKTFTLTLAHGSNPSISIGINDTSQGVGNGGQIDLTTTVTTINEGQSFTASASYNLNFATPYDGRLVGLRVGSASTNITESDGTLLPAGFAALVSTFQGGELVAQNRSWTITVANDLTTEGPETLVLELIDESNFIYDTQTITINDTSIAPAATISLYSSSPAVNSGTGLIYLNETTTKTLSLTVTVTHNIDNVPIYWKTTGTGPFNSSDVDTALSGTIYTVVGSVQRTLPNIIIKTDYTTEITAESFVIGFYSDSAYNNLLYQAPTVSVNDTSQTPTLSISNVSITPAPVSEGNTVTCVFTIQDSAVQTVYFKIVGSAGFTSSDVASYTPANNSITTATGAGEQRTITVTLTADQTTEGTEQFFIYFFTSATWNSGNPVDANKWGQIGPISVSDTSTTPVRTFLPSVAAVNEGESFQITFSTNQTGSFAYTITGVTSSDISGAALTGTVINGTVLTYTATADSTSEGDETFVITLNSYPTVTANVLIKDTSIVAPPSADVISLSTLGKSLNMGGLVYVYQNVYWVRWTLSSATEIIFSTEHELPIASTGTDTVIAIYDSSGTLMHTSGLGDDLGVNGRGVDYSSRITMTLGAGTYYGAIGVYSGGYLFLNGFNTTGLSQTSLQNNASYIRVSLWTGTPNPQLQDVTIPTSVNEGNTAIFSFTLLDTLDRSIYHRLILSNSNSADFTTATSGNWVNAWPRSTNNLSVATNADALTEAATESFYWQLSTTSDFSNIFYASNVVIINDTSQTAVPTWSFGAPPGNLSEGIVYNIQFNASNWNGNTAYFTIQGPNNGGTAANSADVIVVTATLAVNSNSYSGFVYLTVVQDYVAEGDEWFRVVAQNSSGTQLAISDNIKIVSHSAPNYIISNLTSSMNEGTAYAGTFTAYNIRNTTFTLKVTAPGSGTAATSSEITISPSSLTTSSDSDTSTHQFTVTPTSDGVAEGNEYFRLGAFIGTSLATQTGDILIAGTASAPTGTFSVSPASHTGYANITGTWSISGSPVPVVNITGSNGFEFNNAGTSASGYALQNNIGTDVTYTLTASNSAGTLTLTSSSLVPAVSVSLSASPSTITSGQSTTLTYSTTNATSAQISPGVGALSPVSSGSVVVSPTTTTTYTLGANNVEKVAQTTATVTVTDPPLDLFAVNVVPNPITAVSGGTVPYTVTVYLNRATPTAIGIDIEFIGSYLYDGTYTNLVPIAAGATSGSWSGALGDEQGSRITIVKAKKAGFASTPSQNWVMNAAPPPSSGTMIVTGSSSWNYSGNLTSASPLTGTSTNSYQDSTTAYINFIVQNGGGTVYYSISSSSEANYDYARIKKNGVVQAERSGLSQTMLGSFAVSATNTVVVEYFKDGSVSSGTDSATINSLYFVPS